MQQLLGLLLPALFPSWRFFAVIAPAPRVEFAVPGEDWQVFRPKRKRLTLAQMLVRLIWNPSRNEELYLASLAERLVAAPSEHSEAEIARLIGAKLASPFRFRLVFTDGHREAIGFISDEKQA